MIGRAVAEWIGKTPDSKCPDHVQLRIWERCKGRCHISGNKIQRGDKWDLDHIIALCNGGENRESNLAPALRDKHREKTAADVAERARVDRIRKARPRPNKAVQAHPRLTRQRHPQAYVRSGGALVMTTRLVLTLPPSTNHLFINIPGKGRAKSKTYKSWIKAAGWELVLQHPKSVPGSYRLHITVPESAQPDIDNLIKPISDLLQMHGVIENDRLAKKVTIERTEGTSGAHVAIEAAL